MQGSSISFWKRQRRWAETERPTAAWRGDRFSCSITSNTHFYTRETVTKINSNWQLVERRPLRRKHQVQAGWNSHCNWFTELNRSCLFCFFFLLCFIAANTAWQIIHVCVISRVTRHWYSLDSRYSILLDPGLGPVMKKTDILQQHSSKVTICLT